MDGTITSAGTITGELSVQQTLNGELSRAEREYVGVQDVEVDGVSVVTDSVASIDLTGKADVSSLATVATTGDYDDLTDKPTIPSKTSDLTNDSGFITGYTETDPTVPSWAKASSKPSYTFSEIGTTPTSISGYGITDAYTKSEIDGLVSGVLHYKGTKATTSALPSSGNTTGDVWHVTADGSEWAWDGTQWQELGTAVDLSGYVPTSRTVNGKALSSNISLTASDVSALPSSTVIPIITDTYSGTSSNGMSGKAVKSAIDALATVATSGSYNDLSNKPTIPAKNIWYATCSSAADTVAKEATSAGGNFVLATGNMVRVRFTYGNTATGATLSIDGCTATGIYRDGHANTAKYMWANSEVIDLVYDEGKFIMSDGSAATTSTYGVTKLNSATNSESTTEAATPSAVKAAYDHGGVTSVNGSTGAVTVSVPVTDVTVGGTSVVSSGTAAIPSIPTVPTKVSDLTNDSGFLTLATLPIYNGGVQ